MNIIGTVCAALVIALTALWFRQVQSAYSIYIILAGGVLLLIVCYEGISQVLDIVYGISAKLGENGVYIKILCKLVGIAYICEFAGEICKDAGFSSLAVQVEVAGKLAILVCSLPILQGLVDIVEQVISIATI